MAAAVGAAAAAGAPAAGTVAANLLGSAKLLEHLCSNGQLVLHAIGHAVRHRGVGWVGDGQGDGGNIGNSSHELFPVLCSVSFSREGAGGDGHDNQVRLLTRFLVVLFWGKGGG